MWISRGTHKLTKTQEVHFKVNTGKIVLTEGLGSTKMLIGACTSLVDMLQNMVLRFFFPRNINKELG